MTTTLNNIPVTKMLLSTPLCGAWVADVELGTFNNNTGKQLATLPYIGSACQITVDSFTFKGTAVWTDLRIYGRMQLRVIGGMGFLGNTLPVTSIPGPSVGTVCNSLCGSAGETFSPGLSNQSVIAGRLPSWQSVSDQTLAQNLTELANDVNSQWSVDPQTGFIVINQATFNKQCSLPPNSVVEHACADGDVTYVVTALTSLPIPGQTLLNQTNNTVSNIQEVLINLEGKELIRLTLCTQQLSSLLGPRETQIEYTLTWSGVVQSQNADNTVNFKADDPRIQSAVNQQSIRVGVLPGSQITVIPGARAYLSFANGDPSRPFISSFDSTTPAAVLPNQPVTLYTNLLLALQQMLLGDPEYGPAMLIKLNASLLTNPASSTVLKVS